jgi:hypothetical protein
VGIVMAWQSSRCRHDHCLIIVEAITIVAVFPVDAAATVVAVVAIVVVVSVFDVALVFWSLQSIPFSSSSRRHRWLENGYEMSLT